MGRPRVQTIVKPHIGRPPKTTLLNPARGAMTLEEVGLAMNITRERARQIEASALRKLRVRLMARGIKPDDILPNDWERKEPSIYDPF